MPKLHNSFKPHILCEWQKTLKQTDGSSKNQTKNYPVLCLVIRSCPTLCNPMVCSPWGSSVHGDSPGKNSRVGCHALLQGVFPTQGSNPGLLHCRWILYHLSHQGSPRILEWVACPFSRGSSQPKNQTRVSCTAGGLLTSCATGEARKLSYDPAILLTVYTQKNSNNNCVPVFIEALLITAKRWKQATYLWTNERINKMRYMHTTEYYLALKRKTILQYMPQGWTWKTWYKAK